MADRTIKPDDTNDLVLQNNDGSAKLELNEDQTVKVATGSDAGEDFTVNSTQLVVEGDSGNVGIGLSSGLLGKLHIQEFGTVAGSVSSGADTLVLQNNGGHGGLSVVTNTTSTASLHLGSTANSSNGGLQYDNNTSTLTVLTGGEEKMRISSSGSITTPNGEFNGTVGSSATIPASVGGTTVLLEKFTASTSASKVFNLDSFSSYNNYIFELNGLIPVTDNVPFRMCVGTSSSDANMFDGSGENRTVTVYGYYNGSTGGITHAFSSDSLIRSNNMGNDAGYGLSGTIKLYNPQNSSLHTHARAEVIDWYYQSYAEVKMISGYRTGTTDDAYVKFFYNGSNIASGTITLYGIKDA